MMKAAMALVCALSLAGCATMANEPTATSHSFVAKSPAGAHLGIQMTMHTGVANTPQQTIMLVYNEHNKSPIAIVEGQTKTMSEELTAQFLSIFGGIATGATTAAIGGGYVLAAAEANCPPGTLCGTLVQVQNTAGASADAAADSSSD